MTTHSEHPASLVMIGATGAVGGACLNALLTQDQWQKILLIGRREVPSLNDPRVEQQVADLFEPLSYADTLSGFEVAICTVGVGEPSRMSREDFVRIDRDLVLDFAKACKRHGVRHFVLLSSVGVSPQSRSFFLRTKGELERGLTELAFDQLSLFHPSMILTPENRYGWVQGVVLTVWPLLNGMLLGPLKKFRGIAVARLGQAMANQACHRTAGQSIIEWPDMQQLADGPKP